MNICVFGDSITWGAYDPQNGGWVALLRNNFELREDLKVYNLGICGDTTQDLLSRFAVESKSREAGLIVFAIGINDAKWQKSSGQNQMSLEQFTQNLRELYSSAVTQSAKVIFLGLTRVDESQTTPTPWKPDNYYYNKNIELYDQALAHFCQEKNAAYIPLSHTVPVSELEDGLHPNTKGHRRIFAAVKPVIEKMLLSN